MNRSQSGCSAPAAAAQSWWISPVCWQWQTDSRLVNRNVLRGLDRLRASPCSAPSSFLCLLRQLYLTCNSFKTVPHTLRCVQLSVSLDDIAEASHLTAVSPPTRPSVKGNCLWQICWLYSFSKRTLACFTLAWSSSMSEEVQLQSAALLRWWTGDHDFVVVRLSGFWISEAFFTCN